LKQTIDRMMPEQQRLFNEKLAQARNYISPKKIYTLKIVYILIWPFIDASSSEPSNAEEEPTPKFKCNDEVRKILYDIIRTEEQSIHIANQVA
jgi:hypothetical protein